MNRWLGRFADRAARFHELAFHRGMPSILSKRCCPCRESRLSGTLFFIYFPASPSRRFKRKELANKNHRNGSEMRDAWNLWNDGRHPEKSSRDSHCETFSFDISSNDQRLIFSQQRNSFAHHRAMPSILTRMLDIRNARFRRSFDRRAICRSFFVSETIPSLDAALFDNGLFFFCREREAETKEERDKEEKRDAVSRFRVLH